MKGSQTELVAFEILSTAQMTLVQQFLLLEFGLLSY